jgi:hypothetical protein
MLFLVITCEIRANFEYGGWFLVLAPLIFTSTILLWRTVIEPKRWHEVWFGLPNLSDRYVVLDEERDAARAIEDAEWVKIEVTWNEQTKEKHDELMDEREIRWAKVEARLETLSNKLATDEAIRTEDEKGTVLRFFWFFFVFAAFGLIGIAWDFGMAYALELKFVQGKSWLAGIVVCVAGLVVAGLVTSVWESINESKALKR